MRRWTWHPRLKTQVAGPVSTLSSINSAASTSGKSSHIFFSRTPDKRRKKSVAPTEDIDARPQSRATFVPSSPLSFGFTDVCGSQSYPGPIFLSWRQTWPTRRLFWGAQYHFCLLGRTISIPTQSKWNHESAIISCGVTDREQSNRSFSTGWRASGFHVLAVMCPEKEGWKGRPKLVLVVRWQGNRHRI